MRTIDADKLKDTVEAQKDDFPCEKEDEFWNMAIDSIIKIIDNAPTVDTTFKEVVAYECGQKSVERPHGEWVEGYHDYFETLDCSECGYVRDDRYKTYNFCPNCGTDMRKE